MGTSKEKARTNIFLSREDSKQRTNQQKNLAKFSNELLKAKKKEKKKQESPGAAHPRIFTLTIRAPTDLTRCS